MEDEWPALETDTLAFITLTVVKSPLRHNVEMVFGNSASSATTAMPTVTMTVRIAHFLSAATAG
jgi:hypothetical protein